MYFDVPGWLYCDILAGDESALVDDRDRYCDGMARQAYRLGRILRRLSLRIIASKCLSRQIVAMFLIAVLLARPMHEIVSV